MYFYYQLACTIVSLVLNVFLIYLIINKSSKEVGRYKYLMIYTCAFEILWGLFDLPAEVGAFSYGYAFIIYRVNGSWLTDAQSTFLVVIFNVIFGGYLAIFGAHFVYRYGQINRKFGKRATSGWKFYVLFVAPIVFAILWSANIHTLFAPTDETVDYSRNAFWEHLQVPIENVSYVAGIYYEPSVNNETLEIRKQTWIGVGNTIIMVTISTFCIFFFGYRCYRELSKELSQLSNISRLTANLQKQLFYSLVTQTSIPLVLMHIPSSCFFVCPLLNMKVDLASTFIIAMISLYPAIDPLPSFFIIKSYRDTLIGKLTLSSWNYSELQNTTREWLSGNRRRVRLK